MPILYFDKAFPLFQDWVKNAKLAYPRFNFLIKDVEMLKTDLENAITKAVFALQKEEKYEKRAKSGFDYGYVCGHLQGSLNTLWFHEYIYKQTNDFKIFSVINALDSYLKVDELLKIKMQTLYTSHYNNQINIEGADTKIQINLPEKVQFLEVENAENQVLVALENIKVGLIEQHFSTEIPDFLFSVHKHFSNAEISEIIGH